jgi:multiple sugar transport system ATP-binding protein
MATVTFDHMYKRYSEEVVAVNDLNLEIGDGEFICLVGPSGCGKTTALRCVAGLEEISDGRLLIGDKVVNNMAPKDRDIAMVFQSYALYPHMSVYDNLAFGLKLRKMSKSEIDRRVKDSHDERSSPSRSRWGREPPRSSTLGASAQSSAWRTCI